MVVFRHFHTNSSFVVPLWDNIGNYKPEFSWQNPGTQMLWDLLVHQLLSHSGAWWEFGCFFPHKTTRLSLHHSTINMPILPHEFVFMFHFYRHTSLQTVQMKTSPLKVYHLSTAGLIWAYESLPWAQCMCLCSQDLTWSLPTARRSTAIKLYPARWQPSTTTSWLLKKSESPYNIMWTLFFFHMQVQIFF